MQRNPADAACRPAAELAKRLAPLARGEVAARRHRVRSEAAARACLRGCRRQAAHARRLPGQDRAAEPVGHLVRAVPQGDAGARCAAGASSAATSSRWSRSTSTRATWTSRRPGCSEVGIARLGYYVGFEREGVPGSQGGRQGDRHADDAADRSERLRARHARRSRRMGERGRRQADRGRRSARCPRIRANCAHQGGFGQVGVEPITRAKRSLMSRGTFAAISSRCALVR